MYSLIFLEKHNIYVYIYIYTYNQVGFTSFTSLHLLNLQQRVGSLPAEACAGKAGAAAGVSWDRLVGFGKWKRYKEIRGFHCFSIGS